jgi:hypothetical protein
MSLNFRDAAGNVEQNPDESGNNPPVPTPPVFGTAPVTIAPGPSILITGGTGSTDPHSIIGGTPAVPYQGLGATAVPSVYVLPTLGQVKPLP